MEDLNYPVSARTNVKFFRDENGTSIDQTNSEKNIKHSVKTTFSITMPKKRFVDAKMKKM